jgi:hypothetical protein
MFCQLSWTWIFETKYPFLHLENFGLQEVFLTQQTQFWKQNNVLHATACNIDVFLSRDTCVSALS